MAVHYDTFFASGEDSFRQALVRRSRPNSDISTVHGGWRRRGPAAFAALKGLVYGALCLGGRELVERRLALLEEELERQVLADGGHVERNPGKLLAVLGDLLEIRAALGAAQYEVPEPMQRAIDRMAPMLRYLRGGDGALARFNGAGGEDPLILSAVLEQASPRGKPAARAPATGFERISAGKLTVLVDAGAPAEPPFDEGAHAGTLSLEVTVGPRAVDRKLRRRALRRRTLADGRARHRRPFHRHRQRPEFQRAAGQRPYRRPGRPGDGGDGQRGRRDPAGYEP